MSQPVLTDWLTRLERLSSKEIVLGLERVDEMLGRLGLGRPKTVISVAGTNGKGSSVAMCDALLRAAGLRVGSFTSPHVRRFNERICIDGVEADDDTIVAAFERIEALRSGVPLTYFEYGTLAALVIFEDRAVDAAVLEIGMGGRLDAVNAVDPDASLITNVSLDHCDWLGHDVESIAREKAGVMRRGKPTVFASRDVPATIVAAADALGSDLRLAGRDYDWQVAGAGWRWQGRDHNIAGLERPALPGAIQVQNAAGVLALLEAAGFDAVLLPATVNAALGTLRLEGRMQAIRTGERLWLFDVAHNAAAAAVLAQSLGDMSHDGDSVAIVGMLADKDVAAFVQPLVPQVDRWIAAAAESPRAIPVDELARQVANASQRACLEAAAIGVALDEARALSSPGDRIVVTGSFYLVGPALRALGYTRAADGTG
ncbi:MAG: folylpolyglutamate synthase/dihydrofolate synthase family protein [Woeseiaceae bacterium]|nr:folylpolyglutamate synthase/dihydrofolate synthase family protein [Woeseiaceae bacterium]